MKFIVVTLLLFSFQSLSQEVKFDSSVVSVKDLLGNFVRPNAQYLKLVKLKAVIRYNKNCRQYTFDNTQTTMCIKRVVADKRIEEILSIQTKNRESYHYKLIREGENLKPISNDHLFGFNFPFPKSETLYSLKSNLQNFSIEYQNDGKGSHISITFDEPFEGFVFQITDTKKDGSLRRDYLADCSYCGPIRLSVYAQKVPFDDEIFPHRYYVVTDEYSKEINPREYNKQVNQHFLENMTLTSEVVMNRFVDRLKWPKN